MMVYKWLADLLVAIHLGWIIFMLVGFVLTLWGFFRKEFFDWWLFRILHLCGILYVALLAVMGKYCPLTILENTLRAKVDPEQAYPGSFIIHYAERFVYPDVQPWMLFVATGMIAVFSLLMFILRPPAKIKSLFRGHRSA